MSTQDDATQAPPAADPAPPQPQATAAEAAPGAPPPNMGPAMGLPAGPMGVDAGGVAQLQERLQEVKARAMVLNEQATDFIRARPVVSIVGAVALGYLVGRAASRRWLH